MKIGLLATVDHHIDCFFLPIIEEWTNQGHQVSVATGDADAASERHLIPNLGRRPGLKSVGAISELRKWQNQQDIILTNTAVASTLARLTPTKTPVVYFAHGLHWNDPRDLRAAPWRTIERALLRRSRGMIVLNGPDEHWVRERFGGPTIRLDFGVGLDTTRFARTPPPTSSTMLLTWAGEFSSRKRPGDALNVAARLREIDVPFHLTMLGRGTLHSAITQEVRARNLQESVELVGFGDTNDALRKSHALLHTAHWEGLPRVILEATAVGRPTFGYAVKGVAGAPCTTIVDDGDADQLAGALAKEWDRGALREFPSNLPDPDLLKDSRAASSILRLLEGLAT